MKYLLTVLLCLMATTANADLLQSYNAACHVRSSRAGGSGGVFHIENGLIFILTAGHVLKQDEKKVLTWFFHEGRPSKKLISNVIVRKHKETNLQSEFHNDIAILTVPVQDFLNQKYPLPEVRKISDRLPLVGEKIYSTGCPKNSWPNAFIGRVKEVLDNGFIISPKPIAGRSGSIVTSETGDTYGIILRQNGFCSDIRYLNKLSQELNDTTF